MTDNPLALRLKTQIEATALVADRLAYSLARAKTAGLAPLNLSRLEALSDDEMETLDALIYRYGSLVSNIQDGIFKSIGELEQEWVSRMSNRDKTNLMERLGVVRSAETFSSLAIIRNKLMHDYPEEAQKQLERLNFITDETPHLLLVFLDIRDYAKKFDIQVPLEKLHHLSQFSREHSA